MTPKQRLERIKTVINNGGVYRGYTDSIKPFMEDIKAVEEALEVSYPTSEEAITHEEVIQISKHYNLNINQSSTIEKYALQQQAKDQAHEELVRDVKRYFELDGKRSEAEIITDDEWQEYLQLITKLEKVGVKDV